ncbi:MAG TPA: glycosyltransferase family 2 protein [Candidatus Saccharimonadales bacterium]|nr:glycosyltransferase family 2 protein [Candidatus Saccharimonadales bacterium]
MKRPRVSIVIPTFNRAWIIKNAIDSVINQTISDWELIVVDDGSTDNTQALVKSIEEGRIKLFSQKNKGPAEARNLGISKSNGKWIAYLDSDNEFLPNYLEVMLKHLESDHSKVFAIPKLDYTLEQYENGKLIKTVDYSEKIPDDANISDIFERTFHFDTNGLMHLRRIFDEGTRWDADVSVMEDWEFALSIGEKYPEGFLFVPEILANYHQRYGSDGMVASRSYQDIADGFEVIYSKHKNDKMMKKQKWYPSRVKKWSELQKKYEAGDAPPHHEYYFSKLYE